MLDVTSEPSTATLSVAPACLLVEATTAATPGEIGIPAAAEFVMGALIIPKPTPNRT